MVGGTVPQSADGRSRMAEYSGAVAGESAGVMRKWLQLDVSRALAAVRCCSVATFGALMSRWRPSL